MVDPQIAGGATTHFLHLVKPLTVWAKPLTVWVRGLGPVTYTMFPMSDSLEPQKLPASAPKTRNRKQLMTQWYLKNFATISPFVGIYLALYFYVASWGPSLLPRNWIFQGLIAGTCAAVGFGAGVLAGRALDAIARITDLEADPRIKVALHSSSWTLALIAVTGFPFLARHWQVDIAAAVGMRPISYFEVFLGILTSIAIFSGLVAAWRALSRAATRVAEKYQKKVNKVAAWAIGVMSSFGVTILITLLVIQTGLSLVQNIFYNSFYQEETWLTAPVSPLKSGSAASNESWDSLGSQGRSFVAKGTTKEKIEEVTGKPALEPIRVYAGLDGRSADQAADAAVAELERTNAFDREYLFIATTTGAGNVNHWSATAFEYLTQGDCALVAIQHSRVPSAFQFLSDRQAVVDASNLLYHKIMDEVNVLPEADRPKIYLHAESIGAFGAASTFTSFDDMASQIDGALFMGTPDFTPMTRDLTAQRSVWSTAFAPVVNSGRDVRFVFDAETINARPSGEKYAHWQGDTRVIFIAHESDPISRWDWKLLWERPPWLTDHRHDTIAEPMSWIPMVTFFQVAVDMASSMGTPPNEGHLYHAKDVVPAWGAILGVPGDYDAIIKAVAEQHGE